MTYAAQELVMPRVSTRESSIPLRTCVTVVIAHRLARLAGGLRARCDVADRARLDAALRSFKLCMRTLVR